MPRLISVAIPMYNAEKTIESCLFSAMNQTYSSLEILVVNDYSTDRSIDVVKSLALKDKRIRLVNSTMPFGIPGTYNMILSSFKGDFLTVLESDDLLKKDAVEKMISAYDGFGRSGIMVVCHASELQGETEKMPKEFGCFLKTKRAVFNLLSLKNGTRPWGRLFPKDIVLDVVFDYSSNACDATTIFKIAAKSNGVLYIPYTGYVYRYSFSSFSHSISYLTELIKAYQLNLIYARKKCKKAVGSLEWRIAFFSARLLVYSEYSADETEAIKKKLKPFRKMVFRHLVGFLFFYGQVDRHEKLVSLALCFAPGIYARKTYRSSHKLLG